MRSKMNKRGIFGVGSAIAQFVSVLAIAIILLVFVFYGSGLAKTFGKTKGGLIVYDEDKIEIGNVLNYSDDYVSLTKARFLLEEGKSLDEALTEVEYDE